MNEKGILNVFHRPPFGCGLFMKFEVAVPPLVLINQDTGSYHLKHLHISNYHSSFSIGTSKLECKGPMI